MLLLTPGVDGGGTLRHLRVRTSHDRRLCWLRSGVSSWGRDLFVLFAGDPYDPYIQIKKSALFYRCWFPHDAQDAVFRMTSAASTSDAEQILEEDGMNGCVDPPDVKDAQCGGDAAASDSGRTAADVDVGEQISPIRPPG